MKVKLRKMSGTYYLLIKRELKEILGIGDYVDIELKDGKIIISKIL